MASIRHQSWARAVAAAVPVLALGVALSIGLGAMIQSRIDDSHSQDFEREADSVTNSVVREIERHAGAFDDVILFAEATWPGDIDEWKRFVTGRLNGGDLPAFSSGAAAIERVGPDEIEAFVARETESSGRPFTITQLGPIPDSADRLVLTRLETESVGGVSLRGLELTLAAAQLGITFPEAGDEISVVSLESAPTTITELLGIAPAAIADNTIVGTDAIFLRGVFVDGRLVGWAFAPVQLGNLLFPAVDDTSAAINISVRAMEFNAGNTVGEYAGDPLVAIENAAFSSQQTSSFAGLTWQIDVWADESFGTRMSAVRGVHGLAAGLALTLALAGLVAVRQQHRTSIMAAEFETSLQRTLAETDSLTGLLNRQGLATSFGEIDTRNDGASVFFVDVDDFKRVNDQHGHAGGDRALIQVGEQLRAAARSRDLIARLGGDEFLVVCPGLTDSAIVEQTAKRMSLRVGDIYEPCPIQVSVGVAIRVAGERLSLQEMLHLADAQMYEVKKAGGGGSSITEDGSLV